MIGRIVGGVLLGALAAAVTYEIVDREKPELIERIKGWFGAEEEDFIEPDEVPADL